MRESELASILGTLLDALGWVVRPDGWDIDAPGASGVVWLVRGYEVREWLEYPLLDIPLRLVCLDSDCGPEWLRDQYVQLIRDTKGRFLSMRMELGL